MPLKIARKKVEIKPPSKGKDKAKLWFAFPDIHFPEHDEEALAVALEAHRILQPTHSLILGDAMDCGLFSQHPKRTIDEDAVYDYKALEVDPMNAFVDRVQANTKEHTWCLEGNHEARIERWAVNSGRTAQGIYKLISPYQTVAHGREKFTWVPYSIPTGMRRGYVQIVPQAAEMRTGGLVAVHGWSFARHAASVHMELSRSQSILFGHTHRQQLECGRDPWTGALIKGFSPGTLSKLEPLYAVGGAPNSWSHGFALIYVGKSSWTEYLISIVRGTCVLPDGREIKLR